MKNRVKCTVPKPQEHDGRHSYYDTQNPNYRTVMMQMGYKFLPLRVIGLEKIQVVVPLVPDHLHKQRKLTAQLISYCFFLYIVKARSSANALQ
jgi:hypothetical protein